MAGWPDAPKCTDVCSYAVAVALTAGPRQSGPRPSVPLPGLAAEMIPETRRYRLKNKLLGPPLVTEQLSSERLGRPTALAILSSDVISSSAYATEQALIPLIKVIGVAAFSLLMPVSVAVIVVLAFVTLSYLEVVKVYTKAGGAYVVARENFSLNVAQVAAVSLLIDYSLTVAVSVAAGVAALTSVFPALVPGRRRSPSRWSYSLATPTCAACARRDGSLPSPPTSSSSTWPCCLVVGATRAVLGQLHAHSIHQSGAVTIGHPGAGVLFGAGAFVLMRSFASGGSALTGTEAISNGVSVFRQPESRNARITMIWMSCILGSLVLGVSALAAVTHPVPYVSGTPTVVYQVAKYVYGSMPLGRVLVFILQASTVFILVLAANTSFTGFPFLASFAADDSYLPRQLTRRGHRLVFSTGIIVLTVVSVVLLLITRSQVDKLIPLYAIGVFTGFTMAGAGMVRYHLKHKEDHWRRRAAINGTSAVLSLIVDLIIVVTKFTEGAWAIVIILPLGVIGLIRLHGQYEKEEVLLETGAIEASEAPILRRNVVIVLVDRLDMATARAIQYARTLTPDDLRAVHFDIDSKEARALGRGVGSSRSGPPAARHHRVPRPSAGPRRHRVGGRRHPRRRHRVHRPVAPTRLPPGVAALPARPHGRQDRRRAVARCPTSAPPSSRTTCRVSSAIGCAPMARRYRSPGCAAPKAIRRPTTEREGPPTPRLTPRGGAAWTVPAAGRVRAGPPQCPRPTTSWRAGPVSPSPSAASSRGRGSRWPAG